MKDDKFNHLSLIVLCGERMKDGKFNHLSFFHQTVQSQHCLSYQYAGRVSNMNLVFGLALHEFSVAQWIERPVFGMP